MKLCTWNFSNLFSLYAEISLKYRFLIGQLIMANHCNKHAKGICERRMKSHLNLRQYGALYKCHQYSEKRLRVMDKHTGLPLAVERWSKRRKDGSQVRETAKRKLWDMLILKK